MGDERAQQPLHGPGTGSQAQAQNPELGALSEVITGGQQVDVGHEVGSTGNTPGSGELADQTGKLGHVILESHAGPDCGTPG